ncbi:hypothetical protein FRC08_016537 [Ceratobasidium sp. 394]|nr:hypothetical protein FRC08_016537 [Ceratobasidium sp. 394]KAG9094971.1 hypothetical protein FS749_011386 [Ceratobasidium sp. UAMH 11750]
MKSVPTGNYHKRLLDIHPLKGESLPTDDSIRDFFSKFGSILEFYHSEPPPSQAHKLEHVYLVFDTDEAALSAKKHIRSLDATSCWKKSCSAITGVLHCPPELMRRIRANPSLTLKVEDSDDACQASQEPSGMGELAPRSAQLIRTGANTEPLGKRVCEESPDQDTPNKKGRFVDKTNGSGIAPDNRPESTHGPDSQNTQDTIPQFNEEGPRTRDALIERLIKISRSQPSALKLAEKAAELALDKANHSHVSGESTGVRTKLEQLEAERDQAIIERDAAVVSCRALERELRQLKKLSKENKENTDKVLRLVTASLQSLQGESEESDA